MAVPPFILRAQSIPASGYKNKSFVYTEGIPSWSRPAVNGTHPGDDHNPSKGCFGRARPIRHWRKQLHPIAKNGTSRSGMSMSMDSPGAAVLFSKVSKDETNCKTCTDSKKGTTILTHIAHPGHCLHCPEDTSNISTCCNSKKSIRRTANTRIPLHNTNSSNSSILNNYYPSNKNYLYAKCKTYNQNLGGAVDGTVSLGNMYASLTCPNGACGNSSSTSNKPMHVFKPNNAQFQVQGAVSSSDRITRLKLNTIQTNAASFHNAFTTTTSSSLHSYAVNEAGPHFLKSKLNPLNECRKSLPVHMRRACPPKPPQ